MIKPDEIEVLRHTEYNSDPVVMEMLDTLEKLWKVVDRAEEVITHNCFGKGTRSYDSLPQGLVPRVDDLAKALLPLL
jgi:hypothetical protein